ncbi:MAG: DNA methylase, partial [SAR324 cluster bacterium]|nr:DNA methylase [SAR324 cluster bacterium]
YTALLREKLKDPEFRKIEGFPIGKDEDILALSDPPYYTACPNPWIVEFIQEWESQKPTTKNAEETPYHREPFAADVSEGKNDPIYNAHSYHTKVPHKAIMRYILHYTEPGDIVFDGFCGTGMTGVAAQMCGDLATVESLGYRVQTDGIIYQQEKTDDGTESWTAFSKLGARRAVLNDLSPAATFIAYNYNTPVDIHAFEQEASRILTEVEEECGWMYETLHSDKKTKVFFDYVVWSEVFRCPECTGEVIFLKEALDNKNKKVRDEFPCPHCSVELKKKSMERVLETYFDSVTKETKERAKREAILVAYKIGTQKYEKVLDEYDYTILKKIEPTIGSIKVPNAKFPYDDMWEAPRMRNRGVSHVHHLFLDRQLISLTTIWNKIESVQDYSLKQLLKFWVDQSIWGFSILNRYRLRAYSHVNQYMSGVYYIPSQIAECSPWYNLNGKLKRLVKYFRTNAQLNNFSQSTGSLTQSPIPDNSFNYIFIDPPFGDNFAYSELNFVVETWLKIITNTKKEAIVDRSKVNRSMQKKLPEYFSLMREAFIEAYRVLKPGRWITIEFSNTRASIWNVIQSALGDAGFIISSVSALDKKQLAFKAVTTLTAVKQDLVISAYKPNGGFEERFLSEAQTEEGVWDFIRTHLRYLPIIKKQGLNIAIVRERDPRILFDQVVAYYVRKGYPVPISSQEFQLGLAQRFSERDGMYFLPEQVAEYDRKKMVSGGQQIQMSWFVHDEASAIDWLRNLLHQKPQSFQ